MIVQTDFLNRLRDFGLNSYESKLWAALLSRGISTAGELSDIANVPRSRSYDVLESLEKKGFIIVKIGKPIKYIAVPPEEVLERVKKKIQIEAGRQTKMLDEFKKSKILLELSLLHKTGIDLVDPTELSGALKGRTNIYSHMNSLIKNAKKSIIISTTPSGLARKAEELKRTIKKAHENGVKIRIATPQAKNNKSILNELSKYAEIRYTNNRSRFMMVDGENLTFMVLDDKKVHPSYDLALWATSDFFAQSMEKMFDKMWPDMKKAT